MCMNLKYRVLAVLLGTLTAHMSQASESLDDVTLMKTETDFQHSADADNSLFEFKNKTKQPKKITLLNGNTPFFTAVVAASTGSAEKDHGYLRALNDEFFNSVPTRIIVANQVGTVEVDCTLPADKKLYLTYEKGVLRAQEGKRGKTQSGLSLENALTTQDIACIAPVNSQVEIQTGFPAREQKGTNWQIEIKNKTFTSIELSIYKVDTNGQSDLVRSELLSKSKGTNEKDHGYIRFAGIDPRSELLVIIENTLFTLPANSRRKTVYLTVEDFDGNLRLRPQEGTGIFTKKTQSGLPLEPQFNVLQNEITQE